MKLVLAEPKYLKDSINIISDLVNEVTLKIDKNKIELIALDPANVAMVIFRLLSSAFVEYEVDKPQEISINLDSFKQVLRRAKPRDVVILELSKKNQLTIRFKGESSKTFNLALIDIEEKEQKIPDLKFPLRVELPSAIFDESIEDMGIVAESVALIAEKNKFTIQAESKLNTAMVEVTPDEETKITIGSNDNNILARYSIEYLKKIAKASKLSDSVMLEFDKEYPLKAVFRVMDKLDLQFILAPRVSSD